MSGWDLFHCTKAKVMDFVVYDSVISSANVTLRMNNGIKVILRRSVMRRFTDIAQIIMSVPPGVV